jgi:hypothetical protein
MTNSAWNEGLPVSEVACSRTTKGRLRDKTQR